MPQVTITLPSELLDVAKQIQAQVNKATGDIVPRSTAIQIALLAFEASTVDIASLVKKNASFDQRRKKP